MLLICMALLLVGLAVAAQTRPGRSVLRTLGLRGEPARYTELAFFAPRSLPANFVRGGLLHVDFVIHDVEGAPFAYAWQVDRTPDAGATALAARGVARARAGQTVRVAVAVRIPCLGHRERISVRLADPPLRLSYLAACVGPARP